MMKNERPIVNMARCTGILSTNYEKRRNLNNMEDRRNIIKDIEEKKRADVDARNRLLEGLGETLLGRIGEDDPFSSSSAEAPPRSILLEYRRLQNELSESNDIIKSLNDDILRIKELEEKISVREDEYAELERELIDIYTQFGKLLLGEQNIDGSGDYLRQQEGKLIAKIEEQEGKLEELKERDGGIFTWIGKNAQIAVSRTLLQKNRSALQRFYHSTGENFFSNGAPDGLSGEAASLASKAVELREIVTSLSADLSVLKIERRKFSDVFGVEGSPSRRIQGLEKHIAHVKGEIPGIFLKFGALAAESGSGLSAFLSSEDEPVQERAEQLKFRIAEEELEIEKIKAAISIDDEQAEIEKIRKAILGHRQRIADTEETISDLEKHISESERHIEELNAFINGGSVAGTKD